MEFYFRKDGQNLGPLTVFRVRELLEDGVLTPEHQGWHEGMDAWQPISEIPALAGLLPGSNESKEESIEPDSETEFQPQSDEYPAARPSHVPPPLPDNLSPFTSATFLLLRARQRQAWRRFFARWIDLLLAWLIMFPIGIALGLLEPGEMAFPRFWVLVMPAFIWLPLEALCLRAWGATPGKMMLGLQVTSKTDEALTWRQSWSRAFDVWFMGMGMDLPILTVVLKVVALVRYRQMGETSWDQALELKVKARPVPTLGLVLTVLVTVVGLGVRANSFFNNPFPSHLTPEERAMYEQFRHLPEAPKSGAKTPVV